MIIFYNILVAIGCLLVGYLLGGIPNGVILGKLIFKKDPRDFGSHSSGGTNSSRVLGNKVGWLVIVLDILKTAIAFWSVWAILSFSGLKDVLVLWDGGVFYLWLSILGASIGHCWPIYIHFKGGKTVAVYMGATGGTSWIEAIIDILSFFSVYFSRKKKVSYASLISSGIILLSIWILVIVSYFCHFDSSILTWTFGLKNGVDCSFTWEQGLMTSLVYIIMIFRHHSNIQRLKNGTESSYNFFGK
jgi:glycerol-3-phosphate acyltransferase PlsY